ncbi:2OG-Fe(II) oxygenase [Psychromonas sp. KJ10-2]|uniref:2OG-Fe(II) oxygenase n=1 Tax=Psychromonas sp. KJ10-2 TaxID=3391822 RepID=UPI0039B5D4F7
MSISYRRLNLLYYVTPEWILENGGNFELWDAKVTVPETIVAKFNRLLVMETNDRSWHSVSPVVTDTPRCCVSNYYFSEISPSGLDYFHVTSFTGRPGEYWKRKVGVIDNLLRNTISKTIKIGRGKNLINKTK